MLESAGQSIQLAELCRCFQVPSRIVRYVLERGFVPAGMEKQPASGNHRQFSPQQAFWLALVVLVKRSGVKTPMAAQIADCAVESLRNATQAVGWDPGFSLSSGRLATEYQYDVEIADAKYMRLVTNARPSSNREVIASPWFPLRRLKERWKSGQPHTTTFTPTVVLRVNETEIARLLRQAKWEPASE
jgi:hypothetical protein